MGQVYYGIEGPDSRYLQPSRSKARTQMFVEMADGPCTPSRAPSFQRRDVLYLSWTGLSKDFEDFGFNLKSWFQERPETSRKPCKAKSAATFINGGCHNFQVTTHLLIIKHDSCSNIIQVAANGEYSTSGGR